MEHGVVDFLFRGEAELAFPLFLDEISSLNPGYDKVMGLVYRSNASVFKNPMERRENIDEINPPDYDAIDLEGYIRSGYRLSSRSSR